jgi:hypothetical protein
MTPSDINNDYFDKMDSKDLTPKELKKNIQRKERQERYKRRNRNSFEFLSESESDNEDVDENVMNLFYGISGVSDLKRNENKPVDSDSDTENYVDISKFYDASDDDKNPDNDDWVSLPNWGNFEESNNKSMSEYFAHKETIWDKLCTTLDIDQRLFKREVTQANGNCLFHSLAIAYESDDWPEHLLKMDDKINFMRSIIADTMLDLENKEAANVLSTWNMLYTMAKQENDNEMIRHYSHMECLEDVPVDEILSMENRKLVYNEIMKISFWGEEYCLQVFERDLKVKFILMNSDKQKIEGTNNNFNTNELILLYYSGNHYQPVSYKNEYVFNSSGDLGDIENMLTENNINI